MNCPKHPQQKLLLNYMTKKIDFCYRCAAEKLVRDDCKVKWSKYDIHQDLIKNFGKHIPDKELENILEANYKE